MEDESDTIRVAGLVDDNRRLRRLLDSRDAASELRHRTRNTLAILRTIIRKSADSRRKLDEYLPQLEDRISAIGRAHAAIDTLGHIDLPFMLAEELLFYRISEGAQLSLSGPDVRLEPRAGQVFALAIHELAVNAVEHGHILSGGGIDVAWNVEGSPGAEVLVFDWAEHGAAGSPPPAANLPVREGFGMEVLTRMLAFELKAQTTMTFDEQGLRCRIRVPLTASTGVVIRD